MRSRKRRKVVISASPAPLFMRDVARWQEFFMSSEWHRAVECVGERRESKSLTEFHNI